MPLMMCDASVCAWHPASGSYYIYALQLFCMPSTTAVMFAGLLIRHSSPLLLRRLSTTSLLATGRYLSNMPSMGFYQMQDDVSSTFTYLLWDEQNKDAIIVDPVDTQVDRDIAKTKELGLNMIYGVNTHAHADHITGTYLLKQKIPGLKSVISKASGAQADVYLEAGDKITFGQRSLMCRPTPGHTDGCMSFVADDESFVFTGDTLLIQGCGRTDFQGGSASKLYQSVHRQLYSLPDTTTVYPAHDYKGRVSSTIGDEKTTNPRLKTENTEAEFVEIMTNLNLPYPKMIDQAVPANLRCGVHEIGDGQ